MTGLLVLSADPVSVLGATTKQYVDTSIVAATPTTLPPTGAAGGDLAGSYPNPSVHALNATAFTNLVAPLAGQILTAQSGTNMAWENKTAAPLNLPPIGPAGGDLGGTYPNPQVKSVTLTSALPIGQGGTGSSALSFVDLTSDQSISGVKTFVGTLTVPTPSGLTDAATKGYVDGISAGIQIKGSVACATTGALPGNVYVNGALGVGATLTGVSTGVLTVDGHAVVLNDRVMVKNEAAPANNGIYLCTVAGAVGVVYVLTRTTDMDQPAEVVSAGAFITFGTVNSGAGWIVVGTPPYVVGTTAIVYTQFSASTAVSAGTGLTQSGNVISLTVPVSAGNLPSGTAAAFGVVKIDGTAGDILALGSSPMAGASGLVADASHVHPTTGLTLQTYAASTVQVETNYGLSSSAGAATTWAREDHAHGTVGLTNSAPSVTESIGQSAVLGVASFPARADHVHPLAAAAAPTNSAVGDVAATGAAVTFSPSNHVHGREAFGTPTATVTYGLSAVTGSAATVSHSDHTHGSVSMTGSAPAVTEGIGQAAVLGTSTTPARGDHVHPLAAAAAPVNSAVADVAATGVATTFSASDHRHGRESFGPVVANNGFGSSAVNGVALTVSHSDHLHGLPASYEYDSPSDRGLFEANYSLFQGATSTQGFVSGTIYGLSFVAKTSQTVGNVSAFLQATANNHVAGQNLIGLYSISGGTATRIAITGDVGTWGTAAQANTYPFGTPVALVAGTTYAVLMLSVVSGGAAAKLTGLTTSLMVFMNALTTSGTPLYRFFTQGTTQTALPLSFALSTSVVTGAFPIWAGLSA